MLRSQHKPHYALFITPPNGTEGPFYVTALQYKAGPNQWRPPETRKEALWVVENNFAMVDPEGWKVELVEFSPSKTWKIESKSVAEQYPNLEWSEEEQMYIDPTKIAPEAAGWSQAEADRGRKD